MIAVTPPIIFSKEVAQNRPPHFPARTSSPPEIVSDQISGDGAWMNFRFSRALPPGGLAHAGTRGIRRPGRTTYLARPRRRRLRCRRPRKGGRHAVGARVYVKLRRRLAHAHAARQGRPDTLSQLVLHAWPAVGPR